MNLRQEILREHSKAQVRRLAAWIDYDPERLGELVQLFLKDEPRIVQRAAWILSVVAEDRPGLIAPHLEALIGRMDDASLPVAVKRNVVRLLQFVPIPEAFHGRVMDTAFRLLESPSETVGVRVCSMTVLAGFARIYPDISGELRMIIEDALDNGAVTAGFRARAREVLKGLGRPGDRL